MKAKIRKRTGFNGDTKNLSKCICSDFNLGDFIKNKVINLGYEDFNFSLKTVKGIFFVKVFNNNRSLLDCQRSINIMLNAIEAGVNFPQLHKSNQGYLYLLKHDYLILRICVMDFIEGQDFYTSQLALNRNDLLFIANQAVLINSMRIEPTPIYDPWAITNFLEEFHKKGQYLDLDDRKLIKPLLSRFRKIETINLPHCFVHGDITKANVIKDKDAKLWIVDFLVSNYYPRIQELAVLACDLLFDESNIEQSRQNLKVVLKEYQNGITLTDIELDSLHVYIEVAFAMHVICTTFEKKINKNTSKENEYVLKNGKIGLQQYSRELSIDFFK